MRVFHELMILSTYVRVRGAALPLPGPVQTVLDTIKAWALVIAGAMAVIGLILIGIGMFFASNHGDGGAMFKKLGWWLAGVTVVGAAGALTAMFLP